MFGPIQVVDRGDARLLLLNGQTQGGSLLQPPAASVDPRLPSDAPGPLSSSAYTLGWVLAGLQNRYGSGVMIGLGSGAGVNELLYCCPDVDLTVIEIDPVMVDMALRGFPLLGYYLDRGRLDIKVASAEKYLREHNDVWDFGCADGYTGEQDLVADYLPELCVHVNNIYLNVIDRPDGPSMRNILQILDEQGKPAVEMIRALPPAYQTLPMSVRANWIVTNEPVDVELAQSSDVFPGDSMPEAVRRAAWDMFVSSTADVE